MYLLKLILGTVIFALVFGTVTTLFSPVVGYVAFFGFLIMLGIYLIYADNCPRTFEDGNTHCSPFYNNKLPRIKNVTLYCLEYCRLFCYDHWMKYDSKSNSKWSKFWVKAHGFFWSKMYGRISNEDWHVLCDKISKKKNQKKKCK